MSKKIKILIVDDAKEQYLNILNGLLRFEDYFETEEKSKVVNTLFDVIYYDKPTKAEKYLNSLGNTNDTPMFLICDINFQGSYNPNDNGRTRGLDIVELAIKQVSNISILIITFHGLNDIWNEINGKETFRNSPIGTIHLIKKAEIEAEWTKFFLNHLKKWAYENLNQIQMNDAFKDFVLTKKIDKNQSIEVNIRKQDWELTSLLLGWSYIKKNDNKETWEIIFEDEIHSFLENLVSPQNTEKKEVLNRLITTDFRKHENYKEWITEIEENTKKAVSSFLDLNWQGLDNKQLRNLPDFKTGIHLDINRYNFKQNIIANQELLINWLKARHYVITIIHLIQQEFEFLKEKRNYNDIILKNNIFFTIFIALRKQLTAFDDNREDQKEGLRSTLKQTFYSYLKLAGELKINSKKEDAVDILYRDELYQHEKKWLDNLKLSQLVNGYSEDS